MFTKSSQKPIGKVSSDSATLTFDLLSNLTYMAAVSVGDSPRDQILEWTIKQNYKTVPYFRQVYLLAKRAGYEYARAFQMVARRAKAEVVRSLLLRFAGAISSGYPEKDFLVEEARVEREQYINSYYRSLEAVTKWGDAYAALLVSVSLVVVVAMISTMLSDIGNFFVVALAMTMFFVTGFGVYIIYRTAPYEVKTYESKGGPPERRWAKRLFYYVAIPGAVLALVVMVTVGLPVAFLVLGFSILPTGVMAWLDDHKVDKLDQETSTFIRAIGNVSASLGSTVATALSKLDRRSMGTLEPYLQRLQVRLGTNIRSDLCWEAFRDEVGAELMNRTTRIFVDGVALGGPPDRVGAIASEYALDAALMRARRNANASPFAMLTIPLHFAMTGLMIFILEIMKTFNAIISVAIQEMEERSAGAAAGALPAIPVFQPQNLEIINYLTIAAVIAYTAANALAPKVAKGGHPYLVCTFGAITCIMTGFNMLVIPPVASGLLINAGA
jgi:archaeal flagellar protein FlaJ